MLGNKEQYTKSEVIRMLQYPLDDGHTKKELAKMIGISPQYLSDVMLGRRNPGKRILNYLGLREIVAQYERK